MKTIKTISIESQLVIERLLKSTEGEIVTYKELSALIGSDVRSKRHCLHTAAKTLLHEHRIYFGAVRCVGVKRCSDVEKVDAGSSAIPRIRRTAKRAAKIMTSVEHYDLMPKEKQTEHNAKLSGLMFIAEVASASKQKAITARVESEKSQLPTAKMLEALAK